MLILFFFAVFLMKKSFPRNVQMIRLDETSVDIFFLAQQEFIFCTT